MFGTVWAFLKLRETRVKTRARIDWWGNVTFGIRLIMILIGLTYGCAERSGLSTKALRYYKRSG